MKTKLKNTLFIFLIISNINLVAQNVAKYLYDDNGNRKQRKLVCASCPTPQQAGRLASQESQTNDTISIERDRGMNIFPNPTQTQLNITLSNLKEGEATEAILSDE